MAKDWLDDVDGAASADSLAVLAQLVAALDDVMSIEESLSNELKKVQDRRRKLEEEEIPSHLDQYGFSEVRLADGRKVVVSVDLRARIPADAQAKRTVLDWILANGGSGMIHDEITLEDPSASLVDSLVDNGVNFSRTDKVNTNSFQAFLREMLGMKKGFDAKIQATDVPPQAGLYIFRRTKVQ